MPNSDQQARLEEAEEKYQQVLKMDEGHPASLANIAAIQLHMKKNVEAEANLKKALELNPQYGYALSLLGILYLQQDKVDEALDALSRSAQIDPKKPLSPPVLDGGAPKSVATFPPGYVSLSNRLVTNASKRKISPS